MNRPDSHHPRNSPAPMVARRGGKGLHTFCRHFYRAMIELYESADLLLVVITGIALAAFVLIASGAFL